MKHRLIVSLIAIATVSLITNLASAQVTVFDPFNYEVNKDQVRRHWEVI